MIYLSDLDDLCVRHYIQWLCQSDYRVASGTLARARVVTSVLGIAPDGPFSQMVARIEP